MSIPDVISQALSPHATAMARTASSKFDQILNKLDELIQSNRETGRPSLSHWQYYGASPSALGTAQPFAVPLIAQSNEVLLVQTITVDAVATITIRAGGALRYVIVGPKTEKISGSVVVMPGENVTFDTTAACNITLGVVREKVTPNGVQKQLGMSGEHFSGKNTHEVERDVIETRTGLWDEPGGELRPSEGLTDNIRFPA